MTLIFKYLTSYVRLFVLTPVVEKPKLKHKTQTKNSSRKLKHWEAFPKNSKNSRKQLKFECFFREVLHILSFLLQNMFKNRNFHTQKPKSFKNYLNVSKLRGKFQKLQKKHKTQGKNSSFGRISPRLRDQVVLYMKA